MVVLPMIELADRRARSRYGRRALPVAVGALVAVTGCTADPADQDAVPGGPSTGAVPGPSSEASSPSETAVGSPSASATPTRTTDGGVELGASCTSPEGFAIEHPDDWSVNPGDVAPACTRFSPEPFEVEPNTDARGAAIVFDVEPVDFDRASRARADEESRTPVVVDGRDGVRVERVTRDGLYPVGTRIATYIIDLGSDGTLVANSVDVGGTDYARAVEVLDAMMGTLQVTGV
jgi:hypothetical protein